MIFRQLFDPQSSTYTYLLADRESGEDSDTVHGVLPACSSASVKPPVHWK